MNEDLPLFPRFMRPLVNYNYSHSGQNIISNNVAGGSSRITLDYYQEKVAFNLSFVLKTTAEIQILNDWYFNIVCQGTRKFKISLNATGTFEDFVCIIVPGSFSVTGNRPFQISMTVEAEKIAAPFNGQLYLLYAQGYSNLESYFERIAVFANSDLV